MTRITAGAERSPRRFRPRRTTGGAGGTSISGSDPGRPEDRYATSAALARGRTVTNSRRHSMAKKARRKKARRKNSANHGKRPNS
ncbi:hypothetical protein DLE60_05600 [Micromonospora globispora]|uniref:Uncharacterized protein n=1 Tax=Micromonospora globispora TaxID=1450148 RepID=A0A317K2H8_9ACTN|nr:hypothetical protein [Micromonospora globispora]PWU47081.1 hypothetical protein DLJ46_15905 [Micromonospora globispora]PWU61448.1 hypothetical protein DLE60_05600 [Micromonospora globispora]RQW90551.1 hypothetical protein DKL51_22600 [Micromonospora globispora]